MRQATAAIHTPMPPIEGAAAVIAPIYQTSTFALEGLGAEGSFSYSRYDNPNRAHLEATVAALEGARFGHAFASGMAAIHASLSDLKAGDHLLVAGDIYGGTMNLTRSILEPLGVEWSAFDPTRPGSVAEAKRPNTKRVIFESPTNPTLKIIDIARVCEECRAAGIRTVFDNTFASPILQNPLALGADVVVHSATKYIGGHSDVTGGILVTDDEAIDAWTFSWLINSGATPAPMEAWLTLRGMKTLPLRMARHCANAQIVAEALAAHPKVLRVNYPGLSGHPGHDLAARQMKGGFGGMMSAVFDSVETARCVVERVRLFVYAPSLGGVESLIGYPAKMSHAGLSPEERAACGIPDSLLRISVGIEDPDDLVEDLRQALG